MSELKDQEAEARSYGRALLDASRIYEDFLIPRSEGRLRRRRLPPYRSAIIGLVGRQRRFLRAAYTLADTGQVLEAVGPLRSMFEFLVCQRWLAHDPDRNWKLWMEDNHAALDRLRKRLHEHAPALHDAAAAALTPEQREEANVIAAVRTKVAGELGDRGKGLPSVEQRAGKVDLAFLYDLLYRYESSAGTHPTLHAVDLLLERSPRGLLLRGEPTAQFAAPPVYLHGAHLLYEALNESGEHTPALRLSELPSLGRDLHALAEQHANARLPNWQELLASEAFDQA
ncbi:MAG TPA: DUF5677 domain-containing protein [Solirubrobacteraceae bacterium]|jgi:hypothetical protein